jgi:hypothetical protein
MIRGSLFTRNLKVNPAVAMASSFDSGAGAPNSERATGAPSPPRTAVARLAALEPLTIVAWAVGATRALAPVLLVPAAATVGGPTHLYSAWVAAQLRADPALPFADVFEVRLRPGQMLVTATALRVLGPGLGWELAERIWLGALLLGLLLALAWYVRGSAAGWTRGAPLLLAWIPLSWVAA